MKKTILCLAAAILALAGPAAARAAEPYEGYTYDRWGVGIPAAVGYEPVAAYYGDADRSVEFNAPEDLFIDEKGRLFVLNTGDQSVVILNSDFSLIRAVRSFALPDGGEHMLQNPRSIAVRGERMYIADYEDMSLLVCDLEGRVERIIRKPDNEVFPQEKEFRPFSVATDTEGNIYALVLDVYQGAAVFTPEGEFTDFYGSNYVSPTLSVMMDRFWKSILNADQRVQIANYVPVQLNSMDITDDGFMYSCTGSSVYGLSRLRCTNPIGADVWKSENSTGDEQYGVRKGKAYMTEFADVTVTEDEFIYALDATMCRVFMYDPDHDMVFSFGGRGNQTGTFSRPVAVDTHDRLVYVLDAGKSCVTVFRPTEYGGAIIEALGLYLDGQYDASRELWEDVLRMNGNESSAYRGIGKALLYSGEYKEAMTYFKKAGNRINESRAFERYRTEILREAFPVILVAVILLAAGIAALAIVRRVRRRKKGGAA